MATEIRVPTLGESVTEATIGQWFKKVGDAVAVDEPLVELETDKVTVEVPAPSAGMLTEIVGQGRRDRRGRRADRVRSKAGRRLRPSAAKAEAPKPAEGTRREAEAPAAERRQSPHASATCRPPRPRPS